jgi:hypothetical protein
LSGNAGKLCFLLGIKLHFHVFEARIL